MEGGTRYLIRSASRVDPTTDPSLCMIPLQTPITQGTYEVAVAILPNSVYNISSTNNTIFFSGTGDYTGTITAGHYTSSTIATAVQTAMNAVMSGFTVTLDANSNKLTFANASSFHFSWSRDTTGIGCEKQLGFQNNTDSATGTSITAPNAINLIRSSGIIVRFSESSSRVVDSKLSDLGSLYYPIISDWGTMMIYTGQTSVKQYLTFFQSTSALNIRFYSSDGSPISLLGNDWEMVLSRVNY